MIRIGPNIVLRDEDLIETFLRADGPGGQNVNKVETAVQLRFDLARAEGLDPAAYARILKLAGTKATKNDEIIILARRHRMRERNRIEARERLIALIEAGLHVDKPRRATKPTRASKQRRLDGKAKDARTKALRQKSGPMD